MIIILYLVPTAQHYYKQELHHTRARMHKVTEPGCLEELNPQSSGLAVVYKEGELEHTYLKRFLSGNRRSRSKQQTDVNFLESSEPTAHVQ